MALLFLIWFITTVGPIILAIGTVMLIIAAIKAIVNKRKAKKAAKEKEQLDRIVIAVRSELDREENEKGPDDVVVVIDNN